MIVDDANDSGDTRGGEVGRGGEGGFCQISKMQIFGDAFALLRK